MAWGLTALAVVAFLLLANVLVETGALQCPGITIVSRNSWGARPPRVEVAMKDPRAEHVFIHHTTGPQCKHKTSCIRLVRSQQKHHMDTNRWPDISYNFLVGGDGLVYEGRGFGREGAHTHGYNRVGIAIAFVGDYNRAKPSQRMLLAAKRLISCGVRQVVAGDSGAATWFIRRELGTDPGFRCSFEPRGAEGLMGRGESGDPVVSAE
ncbi:hypothetical protein HPB49_018580 [Dermacentor silvarum]|uniref:Uncharacterized protein n=1 Tax=Dermacentor silvarum TaxID=543639 RepID=A0ACB8CGM8_DERSI|nr:hypothetical protein HPB49_018580 [Dermacentor silvarum]